VLLAREFEPLIDFFPDLGRQRGVGRLVGYLGVGRASSSADGLGGGPGFGRVSGGRRVVTGNWRDPRYCIGPMVHVAEMTQVPALPTVWPTTC
jgi:hypothetical protein